MAVLHITYKPNPDTAAAAYEGFCNVLKSYCFIRLSESNWVIHTEEPPKTVWQKLKRYSYQDEYLVMLPLDVRLWTSQDQRLFSGYWSVHRF